MTKKMVGNKSQPFFNLLENLEIIKDGNDRTYNNVEIDKTADKTCKQTDYGNALQDTDEEACDSAYYNVDENVDDEVAKSLLSLEGIRKNLLKRIHCYNLLKV